MWKKRVVWSGFPPPPSPRQVVTPLAWGITLTPLKALTLWISLLNHEVQCEIELYG